MKNYTVTIVPNGRKIEVEPGGNLLTSLVERLALPEHSVKGV